MRGCIIGVGNTFPTTTTINLQFPFWAVFGRLQISQSQPNLLGKGHSRRTRRFQLWPHKTLVEIISREPWSRAG